MTATVMDLTFTLLTPERATSIEPWFDDPDTVRHLGGRDWIYTALHLMQVMPGYTDGDVTVLDRRCWIVEHDGRHVALLDVEVYNDATASLAIVVAPEQRQRGIARRVLTAMWGLPDLAIVDSVFGCIDAGNTARRRCLAAAGFIVDDTPDHDGMLRVVAGRPAAS